MKLTLARRLCVARSAFHAVSILFSVLIFLPLSANSQGFRDLIHFGDLIDVDVVGSTEFDWRGELTPEGFLSGIPFTDKPVRALCMETNEVAQEIAGSYGRFLNRPEVRVTILDRSGRLSAVIYGAVKTRQRLRLFRKVNLAETIVLSGGLTSRASGEITILRQPSATCGPERDEYGENERVVGESVQITLLLKDLLAGRPEANPEILYGDIITVVETRPVYIMGGVANPGRVDFREGLTVSRAVASAGGTVKGADRARVTIFRRRGGDSEVIKADLNGISSGSGDDTELSPYDIVDVAFDGQPDRRFAPFNEVELESSPDAAELPVRVID